MPIYPLPQFEADLAADKAAYEALKPPTSIVVRFGAMRMIGEFPYDGDAKPGCGSKLVCRTHRGTELAEMLTSTCPNAGCGHAVTRKQMLEYIDNSGGRDYPFHTDGRVLRVATVEDLNRQAAIEAQKPDLIRRAREVVGHVGLDHKMKIIDAEPILGGERLTFSFVTPDDDHQRVDFRPAVMELASIYKTRIDMRQVGARDEARLNADYERCGQHCCCRQFLKVLKPVSMKQAKIQKATLDPLKISGRCGRLMCCLRYEESTYDQLRANLPRKKSVVMTPDGPGIVIDSQILTQLVLVRLDRTNEDAAYPVESLSPVENAGRKNAAGGAAGGGDEDDDAPGSGGGGGGGPAAPRQGGVMDQNQRDKARADRLVPPSKFRGGGPGGGGPGGGGSGGGSGGGPGGGPS
ncbi:MAG: stage 0 sporulation family protein, partial [Phycisphaerales bacterium]